MMNREGERRMELYISEELAEESALRYVRTNRRHRQRIAAKRKKSDAKRRFANCYTKIDESFIVKADVNGNDVFVSVKETNGDTHVAALTKGYKKIAKAKLKAQDRRMLGCSDEYSTSREVGKDIRYSPKYWD